MTPGGDRAIVVDSDYENKFTENNLAPFYERQSHDANDVEDYPGQDDAYR